MKDEPDAPLWSRHSGGQLQRHLVAYQDAETVLLHLSAGVGTAMRLWPFPG